MQTPYDASPVLSATEELVRICHTERFIIPDAWRKLKEAISRGADLEALDIHKASPLWNAALHGDLKILSVLIAAGAKLDSRGGTGSTPLMIASSRASASCVAFLLAKGSSVHQVDDLGYTVLHYASPFEEHKDHDAAQKFQSLLDAGADIHAPTTLGVTPLMSAAFSGSLALVQLALKAGARIDTLDQEGMNAKAHATLSDRREVVTMLDHAGAMLLQPFDQGEERFGFSVGES